MSTAFPAIGFDPAPGQLSSVDELVRQLSSSASSLDGAQRTLTALAGQKTWEGEAASRFAEKVSDLPQLLRDSHEAFNSARAQLDAWRGALAGYQDTARRYEAEAEAAKQRKEQQGAAKDRATTAYNNAANDPAFRYVGQNFADQNALQSAQSQIDAAQQRLSQADQALDAASKELTAAEDDFDAIIKKAEELLRTHQDEANVVAGKLRKANQNAPDTGFWERLGDAMQRLGHSIQDWCTKHADLLKTIGDWLSTAGAVFGILALATMWCPPLSGGLALAGGALSVGALAAHGAAKVGGADVGGKTLLLDGLGVLPAGKFLGTAAKGTKVALRTAGNGERALKGVNTVSKISDAMGGTVQGVESAATGVAKRLGAEAVVKFDAKGLGVADRMNLAWQTHMAKFSEGGLVADRVSHVFTSTPLKNVPSVVAATRADGSLDPMSWWSRGTQIGLKLKGAVTKGLESGDSDAPAAGALG
ncbi:putative T7SS-secreted protein [Streptomyces fractus]|uniref:putative T7SS-secreted protein n=1 Tax=Streptomyces fractus TaxID=641806 RepID=UPI003CF5A3E4